LDASFRNAPQEFRTMILSTRAPAKKTHDDIVRLGKAAEADKRLHSNPKHACKEGYHRRGVFTKYYPGEWDASTGFFACTAHALKNAVYAVFSLIAGAGKLAFTEKRKRIEGYLGRLEYLSDGVKDMWDKRERERAASRKTAMQQQQRARGKGRQRSAPSQPDGIQLE
jgi:hypothetical protein